MTEPTYDDHAPLWEAHTENYCRLLFWDYSKRGFILVAYEKDAEKHCWRKTEVIPFKPYVARDGYARLCEDG